MLASVCTVKYCASMFFQVTKRSQSVLSAACASVAPRCFAVREFLKVFQLFQQVLEMLQKVSDNIEKVSERLRNQRVQQLEIRLESKYL